MTGPVQKPSRRINGKSNRRKVKQVVDNERSILPLSFFAPDNRGDVSLDDLVSESAMAFLTNLARTEMTSFRGWAVLSLEQLSAKGFDLVLSPTSTNRYHAHVPLAQWGDYGQDLTYNQELAGCIVAFQKPLQQD